MAVGDGCVEKLVCAACGRSGIFAAGAILKAHRPQVECPYAGG